VSLSPGRPLTFRSRFASIYSAFSRFRILSFFFPPPDPLASGGSSFDSEQSVINLFFIFPFVEAITVSED
jgi:hypothetical protein